MAETPVAASPSREMRTGVAVSFPWFQSEALRIFDDFDPPRRLFAWGPHVERRLARPLRINPAGIRATAYRLGCPRYRIRKGGGIEIQSAS